MLIVVILKGLFILLENSKQKNENISNTEARRINLSLKKKAIEKR